MKGKLAFLSILFLVIEVVILFFYNPIPTNIRIAVDLDNDNNETKQLLLSMVSENETLIYESRVVNQRAVFILDSKSYSFSSGGIDISNLEKDKAIEISKLSVYSGTDNNELHLLGSFKADEALIENSKQLPTSDLLTFSEQGIFLMNDIMHSDKRLNICLGLLFLILYIILLLRLTIFSRINSIIFFIPIIVSALFFCFLYNFYTQTSPINQSVDLASNTGNLQEAIPLEETIEQIITFNRDNLDGFAIYGSLENLEFYQGVNVDIAVVKIFDSENHRLYSKVLTSNDIKVQREIIIDFDKQKDSENSEYRLEILPLNEDSSDFQIEIGQSQSPTIGKMKVGDSENEYNLLITAYRDVYDHRKIVIIIALIFYITILTCLLYQYLPLNPKFLIIGIYCLFIGYSAYQMNYYQEFVQQTPDEIAHISYVGYMAENPNKLIPDFNDISVGIIENENQLVFPDDRLNYLGHPPLYYKILQVLGGVRKVDGNLIVSFDRLRIGSAVIGLLAIALAFYIGFSRIKAIPILHLFFATALTSVPMLLYGISGVSNDTLAFLTCTIFFFGILRFSEGKRDWITYSLIAVGICSTVLTKVTAGIMVCLAALIYVGWIITKEKNFYSLFNAKFLMTLPIYFLPLSYFIYVYMNTGAMQPSYQLLRPEEFVRTIFYVPLSNRTFMNVYDYFIYYWTRFFSTWTGISSEVSLEKVTGWYAFNQFGLLSVIFVPLSTLFFKTRNKISETKALNAIVIGMIVTALMQYMNAYNRFFADGYRGSFQSRYYLCLIIVLVFIYARLFENFFNYKEKMTIDSGYDLAIIDGNGIAKDMVAYGFNFLIILITWSLFYSNFLYFLINFQSYV